MDQCATIAFNGQSNAWRSIHIRIKQGWLKDSWIKAFPGCDFKGNILLPLTKTDSHKILASNQAKFMIIFDHPFLGNVRSGNNF
jgi:hypothetical protein